MHEKTNILGSNQVRHKPACTVTEDGWKLEILDGLYYPSGGNKGADQLCTADLRLVFAYANLAKPQISLKYPLKQYLIYRG